jgi:predicted metalloprotease
MRVSRGALGGGLGTLVLVLVALYFGIDPTMLLEQTVPMSDSTYTDTMPPGGSPEQDELAEFVSVVLADTEDTWQGLFARMGKTYRVPKLVLFSGAVQSACGFAQAAVGPFYCPRDEKVYIDLSFYRDLRERFKAPGDFAQAYVVAHEIGHHVQTLLGISSQVRDLQQRMGEKAANRLSVKQELQADCFSGVWAFHADRMRNLLEAGDIEEGLQAASSIGDDRIQKRTKGYVIPESFTHGTSAQRVSWFKRGLSSGDYSECNTFEAADL